MLLRRILKPLDNHEPTTGLISAERLESPTARDRFIASGLSNTIGLLSALNGAITGLPAPGLRYATGVLCFCCERIQASRINSHEAEMVLCDLESLRRTVTECELSLESRLSAYDSAEQDTILTAVVRSNETGAQIFNFCRKLDHIKIKVNNVTSGSWLLRVLESQELARRLKEIRGDISAARANLDLWVQMSQDATLREIASAAMVIGRRSRIRDESDALLKLNPIEASYKASATDEYAKFHAGTRVELMDELRVWSQDTGDTHRIAVLLGAAGSGKSTVAHQFARRADEENLLGASIFFRRGSPHSDYQHRMIPTISYQLATSCRALRPHIVVAAQRHLPIGTHQAMEHQLEELILNALQNVDGELTPLSIVIDGADDRHDGSVHFISTLLRLLRKKTPNLKFLRVLITARPEREILSVIGPFGSTSSIRVISMDDFSCLTAHADIHLYISTELGRCAEDGTFVLLRERQNAVEKLTELSNGFFLYAATLVNALTVPRNTWVCLDIFDKILEGRAVSHSLFTRLDTTYFSVLQNAFHEIRNDPEQMSQVRQILAILARAQDQITPKTIGDLAGIKLSESLDILDRLAAVLRVDGEMGPGSQIGFIHPSFTDFISDIHRCNDYAVLMDPLSDHAWIASRCLFALSQDGALKQNPCQYENIRIQRADCSDLTKRLHENVPEYIRYAVVHWASHFRQALLPHGRAERELDVAMRQFVSEKERLLIWVETMGWMDKLGLAVEILYNAQSWCQFQEPEDHSQPFIAEVLRFVRAHFGDIDSNPGQTVFLFSRTPSSPQPVGFTPIPTTSSLKTFDSSWPSASWEGESDAGRSSTPEAARSPPKCLDRSLSRKRTSIFTADTDCRKRLRTCRSGSRDARAD